MGDLDDNVPGEQSLPSKLIGEEWAERDEQTIAVIHADVVTPEGRQLRAGDVISPNEARRLRVEYTIDETKREIGRGGVVGIQPPGGWQ